MNRDNSNRKKENRNTIARLLRGIIDCAVDGDQSGFWEYCASLLLLDEATSALDEAGF